MAMNNVQYVSAGKPSISGAIWFAPLTATLPTTPTQDMSEMTGFTCVGYVTDEGVTNSQTRDTTEIKAWGGDTILVVQTSFTDKFTFTLAQTGDADVLKMLFGSDNVTVTSDTITVNVTSQEPPEYAFVIDTLRRNGALHRIVIPDGKLKLSGDISYKDNEVTAFPVEITAMPKNEKTHIEIS